MIVSRRGLFFYFYCTVVVLGLCIDDHLLLTLFLVACGGYGAYDMWKTNSKADFRRLTGVQWFQDKFGVDLFGDE